MIGFIISFSFLLLFYAYASDTRAYRAVETKADAIVVLTGGRGRAEEGLALLRKGASDLLILSGVHEDADLDSIFLGRVAEEERGSIILDKKSGSTYENALEVRRILTEKELDSMMLLTSVYHMKRAYYIFRRVTPNEISIIPYGIASPNYDELRWWSGDSLLILLSEFVKYYLTTAGFLVGAL